MAAIARVLGKPADTSEARPVEPVEPVGAAPEAEAEAEPVPLPLAFPTTVTAVPEPSHTRFSPRWVAAPAGIAAAVLVFALLLSGQVNLPGRTVGNSSQNAQQVNSEHAESSTTGPEGTGAPGTSPAASIGGTAPARSGSAPANAAPAAGVTGSTTSCPLGAVLVAVEKVEQHVDSSVPTAATPPTQPPTQIGVTLPQIVRTTASGVLRNTSTVPAVVTPFPVEVTFTDGSGATTATVTSIALSKAVTVQPGQALPWSVVVDNPDRTPFPAGAKTGTVMWRWDDPNLAATCPH
jgi:hypothetical protein